MLKQKVIKNKQGANTKWQDIKDLQTNYSVTTG